MSRIKDASVRPIMALAVVAALVARAETKQVAKRLGELGACPP